MFYLRKQCVFRKEVFLLKRAILCCHDDVQSETFHLQGDNFTLLVDSRLHWDLNTDKCRLTETWPGQRSHAGFMSVLNFIKVSRVTCCDLHHCVCLTDGSVNFALWATTVSPTKPRQKPTHSTSADLRHTQKPVARGCCWLTQANCSVSDVTKRPGRVRSVLRPLTLNRATFLC